MCKCIINIIFVPYTIRRTPGSMVETHVDWCGVLGLKPFQCKFFSVAGFECLRMGHHIINFRLRPSDCSHPLVFGHWPFSAFFFLLEGRSVWRPFLGIFKLLIGESVVIRNDYGTFLLY